ncbi:MAG: twin-arginine translocation signal domain-containing protein [Oscillospiraceae bacterium]
MQNRTGFCQGVWRTPPGRPRGRLYNGGPWGRPGATDRRSFLQAVCLAGAAAQRGSL